MGRGTEGMKSFCFFQIQNQEGKHYWRIKIYTKHSLRQRYANYTIKRPYLTCVLNLFNIYFT